MPQYIAIPETVWLAHLKDIVLSMIRHGEKSDIVATLLSTQHVWIFIWEY